MSSQGAIQRIEAMADKKFTRKNAFRFLLRIPVPWVFILTYLAGAAMDYATGPHFLIKRLPPLGIAGAAVFALGAAIAGWGWLTFRKARTTTVPGDISSRFVTWGPYRFSRNPMYVGLVVAYVGEALILRQIYPVLLLPLVVAYVNWVVIPVEEGKLKEVFGEEYLGYQAKTRRWL